MEPSGTRIETILPEGECHSSGCPGWRPDGTLQRIVTTRSGSSEATLLLLLAGALSCEEEDGGRRVGVAVGPMRALPPLPLPLPAPALFARPPEHQYGSK